MKLSLILLGCIWVFSLMSAIDHDQIKDLLEESKARDAEIYRLEVCAEIRHNHLELALECPVVQPPER